MKSEWLGSCCGSVRSPPGPREARFSGTQAGAECPRGARLGVRWRFGSVLILHALRRAFSTPRSVAALAFVRMYGLSFGPQLLLPNRILQFVGFGLLPEARRRLCGSASLAPTPRRAHFHSPTPVVPGPCRSPIAGIHTALC